MQQHDGERDVGCPIVNLEQRDLAVRPSFGRIIVARNQRAKQDIEREQHHRSEAREAGEVDGSHSSKRPGELRQIVTRRGYLTIDWIASNSLPASLHFPCAARPRYR